MKKVMQRMIADIEREVEYTSRLIGKRALDPRVMKAGMKGIQDYGTGLGSARQVGRSRSACMSAVRTEPSSASRTEK